jgi:hypothetical protein
LALLLHPLADNGLYPAASFHQVTAKHLNHLVTLSRAHLASVSLMASTPPVAITAVTTCSLLPQGSVIGGGIKRQQQQGWGLGGY